MDVSRRIGPRFADGAGPTGPFDESNAFVAAIDRAEVGTGTITFEIRVHAVNSAGNLRSIVASETCTLVD